MSSPDNLPFSQFIKIDRRKSDPIYLQIVYQFIQAVQRRLLEEGDKIPGSRSLSKELNVHRKTILAALEELQAQGWIKTIPSVGTYVENPDKIWRDNESSLIHQDMEDKAGFIFRRSFLLDATNQKNKFPYRFTDGTADYSIIKTKELGRFYSAALKRKSLLNNSTSELSQINPFFKDQLSYYLNLSRGLHISKDNLITANSRQVLLYILTQLLIEQGDCILVGEYSHHHSNMAFQQAGAKIATIPMDHEGIQIDFIRKHFRPGNIKFLYISPQHQYPTTTSLSEKRRLELIALAKEYDFILVEDDSDYELTYEKSLDIPLIKRSTSRNVIYLGCFGKFLPPGFQTDFMIGPKDFIEEANKHLSIFGKMDLVKEQALGEMINEGDIHRYRRKALQTYLDRRNLFAELLKENFSEQLKFDLPKGGLAFWLEVTSPISLSKWTDQCQKLGLFIPRTCLYQNQHTTALRLGFGHMKKEEMEKTVEILREAYIHVMK